MSIGSRSEEKRIYGIAFLMVLAGVLILSVGILYKKREIWGNTNESSVREGVEAEGAENTAEEKETTDTVEAIPHNRKLVESFSYQEHEVTFYRTIGAVQQPEELSVEEVLDITEEWLLSATDKDVSSLTIEICYCWYSSQHVYEISYDDPTTVSTDYSMRVYASTGLLYEYFNLTQAKIPKAQMEQYGILTMDTPMEERDGHKEEYHALTKKIVERMKLDVAEYTYLSLESMGFAEENANYYIMKVYCVLADGKNAVLGINQVDKSLCYYNRAQ